MIFWQKRRVLITGHTGFKGSWLSLWLQLLKADLVGFALEPPSTPNLFRLANVADHMIHIVGDIRDFSLLQQVIQHYQPDIIIHMAAQPLVRQSYKTPVETYATNVMGTVHLLEAARHVSSVKAIINVTSDKCYENKEAHAGYRENDRLGGYDPYSSSKACAELVTNAYRDSYFNATQIGLASVRAGNVIGGGDFACDRLIPDIIRASINKQPILIRHPHSLRPWQHVLESLNGYLMLAEKLYQSPSQYAGSWNFGPNLNDIQSVGWICDYFTQHWISGAYWMVDQNQHPYETSCLKLDCSKAKSKLNWKPRWSLEKGLKETIEWYKAYQASQNMFDISIAQIKNFTAIPLKGPENKLEKEIYLS